MEEAAEVKKPKNKLWLAIKILLLIITYPFVFIYKIRFFEAFCILGLGVYYGYRFGVGKLALTHVYYLNLPCWAELLIAICIFIILCLKIMLTSKERIKITK